MDLHLISKEIDRGQELEREILEIFGGAPVGGRPSRRLSSQFLRLSLMHSAAIRSLALEHQLSALALMRPQVEGCLRGLWVLHQGDDFAKRFMRDLDENESEEHIPKRVDQLLKVLLSSPLYGEMAHTLDGYWKEFESAFHGYTHGGRIALQLLENGVEPLRMTELLGHSRAVAGIAFMLLLESVDCSEEVRDRVLLKVTEVIADSNA